MSGPDIAGVALATTQICSQLAMEFYKIIKSVHGATNEARKSRGVCLPARVHGLMTASQVKPRMPLLLYIHALRESGSCSR